MCGRRHTFDVLGREFGKELNGDLAVFQFDQH